MQSEPSGDYYDYTKTMKPERPWLVDWHQKYVYRIMHAMRGGDGTEGGNPELTATRPPEHAVGGDQAGALYHLWDAADRTPYGLAV